MDNPTLRIAAVLIMMAGLAPLQGHAETVPCGIVNEQRPIGRIVGGRPTAPNQFPWVAMLVRNNNFICGAGIIDPLHVITAAHCVGDEGGILFRNMTGYEIIAGRHWTLYSTSHQQRIDITAGIVHERYRADVGVLYANDIAVLRLARPLAFTSFVSALCLPEPTTEVPEQCVVAGWGKNGIESPASSYGNLPDQLHYIRTPAFYQTQCIALKDRVPAPYRADISRISQNSMCLTNTTHGGRGTCYGDSGSPVFCQKPGSNFYQFLGVHSWSPKHDNCLKPAGVPSVSTFLPPYLTWLETAKKNLESACASNPCQNGATCNSCNDCFTCICRVGFTGVRCETDVNECESTPCRNGGVCNDLVGHYTCSCPSRYTGFVCEVEIASANSVVRLVDGSHPREGRVEIQINGVWGTVCDDAWDANDARVVCRQLGYSTSAVRAYSQARFGPGNATSRIWLDDVRCVGNETRLLDCPANPLGDHNCGHGEDAGLTCEAADSSICSNNPCLNGGTCHDLLDDFVCSCPPGFTGFRCDIDTHSCRSSPCLNGGTCNDLAGTYTCSCHSTFTGLRCNIPVLPGHGSIRLVDGSHPREGRVEILINGTWGTVCDDQWNEMDAMVVCRQLQYNTSAVRAYSQARFGQGNATSRIWLDDVRCVGNETQLLDCPANPLGDHNCRHSEDAGVTCDTTADSNECVSNPCRNGGTCNDLFDTFTCSCPPEFTGSRCEIDAHTCRSSPCLNGGTCNDLAGTYTCSCHSTFTGLRCNIPVLPGHGSIRLVNGSHPREGRVEILISGAWGTVCDDIWDGSDARVVCRQLGFNTSSARAFRNAHFGQGNIASRIWLDDVNCSGGEETLVDCPRSDFGIHNCQHSEDAGVACAVS